METLFSIQQWICYMDIKYGCSEKMVNVAVGVDEREDILQPSRSVLSTDTTTEHKCLKS